MSRPTKLIKQEVNLIFFVPAIFLARLLRQNGTSYEWNLQIQDEIYQRIGFKAETASTLFAKLVQICRE